jgi:hypothetical protein
MSDAPREDRRQQPKPPKPQLLKPATAAKKLGVFLPATPEAFQAESISRDALQALQASPPEWLVTLRKEGPHPKGEVARRLGVSNSALARGGVGGSLTTAQIRALLAEMPEWLSVEREKIAPGSGHAPGTAIGERPTGEAHSARVPAAEDDDLVDEDALSVDEIDVQDD